MSETKFLEGEVISSRGDELIVRATAQEIAQFGVGRRVVTAEGDMRAVPFNITDPVLFNRAGQPVAIALDYRVRRESVGAQRQQLVMICGSAVPVSFPLREFDRERDFLSEDAIPRRPLELQR